MSRNAEKLPPEPPAKTPDGRYIIVRGRLWRAAKPNLGEAEKGELIAELMSARRAVKDALHSGEANDLQKARARVQAAKEHLGERGPVWWTDGAPDFNRHFVKNTPYAEWWAAAGRES